MNNCEKQIILISVFENGIDLNNFCSNGNIFYDICRTFDSNVVHNYFFTKPIEPMEIYSIYPVVFTYWIYEILKTDRKTTNLNG